MSDLPPKFAIALHTLAMERHVLNEPKTLTVQVEEIGMFGERLETENLAFNPVRAGGKLRIDWSREVDIAPGGRAWDALDATLRDDGSWAALRFTVRDVADATGRALGGSAVDLRKLLEAGRDEAEGKLRELTLKEASGGVAGQLTVSIVALDAMRRVRAEARAPAAEGTEEGQLAASLARTLKREAAEASISAEVRAQREREGVARRDAEETARLVAAMANVVGATLQLEVVAARGLAAKDSHLFSADSSDPYVIVAFAGETIGKTEVVAETTEPTWECDKPGKPERPTRITTAHGRPSHRRYTISKELDPITLVREVEYDGNALTLRILDANTFRADVPLGEVRIRMRQLADGRPRSDWHRVAPCPGCDDPTGAASHLT